MYIFKAQLSNDVVREFIKLLEEKKLSYCKYCGTVSDDKTVFVGNRKICKSCWNNYWKEYRKNNK